MAKRATKATANTNPRWTCAHCEGHRHVGIFSAARNYNYVSVPHLGLANNEGSYMPPLGIGTYDNDGFMGKICLDCGRVEGQFPVSDKLLLDLKKDYFDNDFE